MCLFHHHPPLLASPTLPRRSYRWIWSNIVKAKSNLYFHPFKKCELHIWKNVFNNSFSFMKKCHRFPAFPNYQIYNNLSSQFQVAFIYSFHLMHSATAFYKQINYTPLIFSKSELTRCDEKMVLRRPQPTAAPFYTLEGKVAHYCRLN